MEALHLSFHTFQRFFNFSFRCCLAPCETFVYFLLMSVETMSSYTVCPPLYYYYILLLCYYYHAFYPQVCLSRKMKDWSAVRTFCYSWGLFTALYSRRFKNPKEAFRSRSSCSVDVNVQQPEMASHIALGTLCSPCTIVLLTVIAAKHLSFRYRFLGFVIEVSGYTGRC